MDRLKKGKPLRKSSYFIKCMEEKLHERQRINPQYSMRSFSKFLGINPATLSSILNGKRCITQKMIPVLVDKLKLDPLEEDLFIKSVIAWRSRSNLKKISQSYNTDEKQLKLIEDEKRNFKILSEWEYFAILSLIDVDSFQSNPHWISRKLGIPQKRVELILNQLIDAKLIEVNAQERITKNFSRLTTTDGIKSRALRKSHIENLEIAIKKIEEISLEDRCYRSSTIAIDKEKLPEARELIDEFIQKLSLHLGIRNKTDVYQFNIQLFPLTNKSGNQEKK